MSQKPTPPIKTIEVSSLSRPMNGVKSTMIQIIMKIDDQVSGIPLQITPAEAEKLANDLKLIL